MGVKNTALAGFDDEIKKAEELIVKNCNNKAILSIEQLFKSNLDIKQKIHCLEIKKKALFFNQEYANFQQTSRQIHQLEKPHYQSARHALYLAEQSFFFHYLTWQDSVVVYMRECQNILENSKSQLRPEEGAFIHFMMANFQLYISEDADDERHKRYSKIDHHFQIATQYLCAPYIFHDRLLSVIYRSWGSRTLDRVSGYQSLTKEQAIQRPSYKKKLDALVSMRMRFAADCVPACCAEDKVYALALEGLMYSCLDQCEKSNQIFNECLDILKKQYRELHQCPGLRSLCLLLKYKLGNDEKQHGNIPQISWYVELFQKIAPFYTAQVLASEQFRYDTYGASPLHMLGCLLLQKGKKNNNQKIMAEGASYYLENYNHRFLRSLDEKKQSIIRKWIAQNETHFNLSDNACGTNGEILNILQSNANHQSVSQLQNKLQDNEIILLKTWRSFMKSNFRLVISNNRIDWIDCHSAENATLDPNHEPNFTQFKDWALKNYQTQMAPILNAFPNTTKVFVTFNDNTDYECLIDKTTGNHYAELSYLIKKIQFNRIYNIQEYFNNEPVELERKIQLISLIQPKYKALLFTYDMLQNLYRSAFQIVQVKENNFESAFSQKNILHIYGHGENKQLDFGQWQYSIPFYQKNKWQNLRHKKKQYSNCQSLVIFNTCFSGTSGFIYEYDSDLHTNILLNGAPAIIVSTLRSEDKASSMIFGNFYQYLEGGGDFENALHQAKKNYLENQEGELCNPYRWQGFKSITRQKIMAFETPSWWEKLFKWFSNLQYLFGLPALN